VNPLLEPAVANDDYDTPWKDAVTRYFPEFIAFYFPDAHRQIDWNRGYTFLDQELAQIVRDAELGKRLLDKLVQVATHDGGERWVYVHIEVQGGPEGDFAERLFTYNYRLYDKYRAPSPASPFLLTTVHTGSRKPMDMNSSVAGTTSSFPR
jgi:hypothetical protein